MASPEEKAKFRKKRSNLVRELHSPKYRQRVKEDRKKKALEKIRNLTHLELVELIQDDTEE